MTTLFATGWKKDRPDPRDHDARTLMLRVSAPPPSSARNADLVMVGLDQGQLGSCTVNASGQAVRAAELLERVDAARAAWEAMGNDPASFDGAAAVHAAQSVVPFWSRLMAYYLARSFDGNTKDDTGTEIRLVFQAINKYGFAPESAWPYSDDSSPGAPFSRNPSAEAYREAYDQRDDKANEAANLIDYARITSTGTQRIVDIKTAVAARHLVVFGTSVTEAFCSDGTGNGGQPIPVPGAHDAIAGGHALCVAGYDADGAEIANSWGSSYGGQGGLPAGWCKFSWDYMTWSETTDLWIVRRAPLYSTAKAA
jgi:C1A family cysteine protease